MNFTTLLVLDLIVAIPCIVYYYYWSITVPEKKTKKSKEIIQGIKKAYIFTAFTTIYIPALLLYYLYVNLLVAYRIIFIETVLILLILVLVFGYVNYYSFINYEKVRFK